MVVGLSLGKAIGEVLWRGGRGFRGRVGGAGGAGGYARGRGRGGGGRGRSSEDGEGRLVRGVTEGGREGGCTMKSVE